MVPPEFRYIPVEKEKVPRNGCAPDSQESSFADKLKHLIDASDYLIERYGMNTLTQSAPNKRKN